MPPNRIRTEFLRILKHSLNRLTRRLALSGVGPFSLIRHLGRTTGRAYQTPVILARVPEGFIVELTYGDRVDWYRNIVAAGGCEVVYRGDPYRVTAIEPCPPARGLAAFPRPARVVLRALRRHEFRLLLLDGSDERTTRRSDHPPAKRPVRGRWPGRS